MQSSESRCDSLMCFPLQQHHPPRQHTSATAITPSEEGPSLWAELRAGPCLKQDVCHVTCADRQMDQKRASEHEIFIPFCINLKPAASWETNRLTGPSSETAILRSRATDPAMNTREHAHTHKTEGAGLQSYEKITFHKKSCKHSADGNIHGKLWKCGCKKKRKYMKTTRVKLCLLLLYFCGCADFFILVPLCQKPAF